LNLKIHTAIESTSLSPLRVLYNNRQNFNFLSIQHRIDSMSSFAYLSVIAVIGGIAIALQSQFMGIMDKGIGTIEGVFITYCSGGILITLVMLLLRGGNLGAWQSVPWYSLTSGALGLIIVGTIGYTAPRLGLVTTFTIIVAVQFVMGAVLDHFGILGAATRPFDLARLVGIAILLVGIWLIIR
jgi:transporter family-2 protein